MSGKKTKKAEAAETLTEESIKADEEKVDSRIRAMMSLNKKSKISEKDKQAGIYSVMADIKVIKR